MGIRQLSNAGSIHRYLFRAYNDFGNTLLGGNLFLTFHVIIDEREKVRFLGGLHTPSLGQRPSFSAFHLILPPSAHAGAGPLSPFPQEAGALDSPSPHGKEGVPSQGSHKEKKGEGSQEEEGPKPPQSRHEKLPEPGSQAPSGGRGWGENVETRGKHKEEAPEENR